MRVVKEYSEKFPLHRIRVAGLMFTTLFESADFIAKAYRTNPFYGSVLALAARVGGSRVVNLDLAPRQTFKKYTSQNMHVIEAYAELARIEINRIEPFVDFHSEPHMNRAENLISHPAVAVAPHGPSCLSRRFPGHPANKEWDRDNWKYLIGRIPDKYNIYTFGAANEKKLDVPGRITHIYGEDLRLVACMLKKCDVFVGVENGLAHLARAMGARTIVQIHGDHVPVSWTAYPGNIIINGKNINDISADYAWNTLSEILS